MYALCSSVLASTIANIPQSHLHFKVSLSVWSLNIKKDNFLCLSLTVHITEEQLAPETHTHKRTYTHTHTKTCDFMRH